MQTDVEQILASGNQVVGRDQAKRLVGRRELGFFLDVMSVTRTLGAPLTEDWQRWADDDHAGRRPADALLLSARGTHGEPWHRDADAAA